RLGELAGLFGAKPEGDRLPVAREAPLERRPLIDELHGGQHNDARELGLRRAAGTVEHHRRRLSRQPMVTDVKLPRLGQGMESGVIVRWLKSEGDTVSKGEPLYELDTDKVTQEVESEIDGVLTKIVVAEGDVEVGATVATIDAADGAGEPPAASEEASEPEPETSSAAPGEPPSASGNGDSADAAAPAPAASAPAEAPERHGRLKASPLARRIARERGVDLASLHGTGPEGRILAEDVEKAAAGGP